MTELTEPETMLVDAVSNGDILDLTDADDRSIRASVIRDILRGVLAGTPDPRGLRVREAHIQGELDLIDVRTTVPVELESCVFSDEILLDRAQIGSFELTGSEFPSLSAWYLTCEYNLCLAGIRCTGGIELAHARVGGRLSLTDAVISNDKGPALNADRIQTGGTAFLDEDFIARSNSPIGTVRFLAARIGGRLIMSGAQVINTDGPAIYADTAIIDGDMVVDHCRIEGFGDLAALSLIETVVGGELKLSSTALSNAFGPALNADGIQIHGSVFADDGFRAIGQGARGGTRLPGARITGQLCMDGAQFATYDGELALDVSGARIEDELLLDVESFIRDPQFRLECDGMRYPAVPRRARRTDSAGSSLRIPLALWLRLLRDRTMTYAAQPYQQLAATYRAEGHERDARRILVAQQVDLRARGDIGGRLDRTWHRVSGLTIGYGYRPARALLGLLACLVLSLAVVFTADAMNSTTPTKDRLPGACTSIEHVGLAADIAIPLVKTGGLQRCEFSATTSRGNWFIGIGWLIQFLGWAFATLFVAGFTGLVRRQ